MPVTLQTVIGPASAQPRLVDYSGNQVPFLGGPVGHLQRLGNKLAVAVTLPAMRNNTDLAMAWVADLLRGKTDGVVMEWPQPDIIPPSDGAVRVSVIGGETLNLKLLVPGQTIRKGLFLSVITGGRRYVHNVFSASQVVPGTGNLDITVTPLLRMVPQVGDVVEFTPKIQGYLEGDELSWNLEAARTVGLSFTVVEEE